MKSTSEQLHLHDFYPARGMYQPGELVRLFLECDALVEGDYAFTLEIFRGAEIDSTHKQLRALDAGFNRLDFTCQLTGDCPAGYGAVIRVEDGQVLETAFDVLIDWTTFPRYGFLSDFTSNRMDEQVTLQTLAKYHLNGLQFYDWQYRHDELVPPADDFCDPLNRPLSLKTTRKLIHAAHSHGMAAMPYLAIYAASAAFWRAHPDWMLYDADHQPIPFGDEFLGIMNPVSGGAWQKHLLNQCQTVLIDLPFDGLHIDQYGEPKTGFNAEGHAVDLPMAFADFVCAAVELHPCRPVLFNAVGNWPIETLAASPTSFNYIEIWPPDTAYTDLVKIVRNARKLSGQKPVVIALYIPAAQEVNNLLADALIFSAGGTRIELGENGRLLSDPYFPKHEAIPKKLAARLRKWADCIVRYEEWFGPMLPESEVPNHILPVGVLPFFRNSTLGASLSLVNLGEQMDLCWNSAHDEPGCTQPFELRIELDFIPEKVMLIDPDSSSLSPVLLQHQVEEGRTKVSVPALKLWGVILFERKKS